MEQVEEEICTLHKQVEILQGYIDEVVGPLDHEHPEETLNTILKEGGAVHIDLFLKAYQQWQEIFEEKDILIIQGNLKLLHAMQENMNKMVAILKDFSIMDEVRAWSKDLQNLQAIKGQRYQILIDVYIGEQLDMIDDLIEKLADSNKVMETFNVEIYQLKDQAQEQILEVERHYSDACLDIFEDEE